MASAKVSNPTVTLNNDIRYFQMPKKKKKKFIPQVINESMTSTRTPSQNSSPPQN
jgi:hypothetical protein